MTKFLSINVRGIGCREKREKVFQWLKTQNNNFYLLQETHVNANTKSKWESEWGHLAYFSGNSSNSEGVAILLNPNTDKDCVTQHHEIIPGRLQALEITIENKHLALINIYGPNTDNTYILEQLIKYLSNNTDKYFIIAGDFNTILDTDLDKNGGIKNTHPKCRNMLLDIINEYTLIDIWRLQHPDKKQYTWHSSKKPHISSRLDYFLVSSCLNNNTNKSNIKAGYRTDHSTISLSIDFTNTKKGPGTFKLNNSLLLENEYQTLIRNSIKDIAEINKDANPKVLWETIKGTIRNETIKYAAYKRKCEKELEKKLLANINEIENELTRNATNHDILKQTLSDKKQELNKILDKKLDGIVLRAKADFVEFNEKNSKYFSALEKKHAETKIINRLNENNKILTDQTEILQATQQFYSNLYSKKECNTTNNMFFENPNTKLNDEEKMSCEGALTAQECANALKDMKNNTSPGSDGITTEFYKIFWNDIKLFLLNSLNLSYNEGHLSELQSQSLITLLPKPDKDTAYLKNWRPISLLNTDYKIATKAIANRIKSVLPKIITETQTGFIKGRYIGENVRLLEELLDYVEDKNISCLLFFSDFEKAFDSVDHNFLLKSLKHYNFGDSLIRWVNVFYSNIKSSILNNGFMTDFFNIERGVRQGCPLSPYLFITAIEPLSQYISKHKDIKGIKIENVEVKSTLFADDATFITDGTKKSFESLIYVLDEFEKISGLKLNNSKCNVLKAGSFKLKKEIYLEHKAFQWSSNNAKALGISFTTNRHASLKLNLDPKLDEFKTCLKQWQHRKLTLLGKVTVIKTYALPKLIYPLTVLRTPDQKTIKQINDIMYDFLWDKKPAKIKRDTIIQQYEDGGLKMVEIEKFINSLKCSWIKRIHELGNDNPLKRIYYNKLNKHGGNLIFESNLTEKDAKCLFNKSIFLQDIIIAWQKVAHEDLKPIKPNTVIWNNSNIRSGNSPLFYQNWLDKGIKTFEDIFDNRSKTFYTFEFMQYLYNIPANDFMKYLSLINSIPKEAKQILGQEIRDENSAKVKLEKLLSSKRVNKYVYDLQINQIKVEIKQKQKWTTILNKDITDWKPIFRLSHEITLDNTIRNFNYKYLMGIIRTNKELFKFSMVNSTLCDFCGHTAENICHLFWECEHTQAFWVKLSNALEACHINVDINFTNISLGILNIKQHKIPVNYIIVLAKYFIFKCKCQQEKPNFNHFKNYFKEKINIEKHIAYRKGKAEMHNAYWNQFQMFTAN